MWMKSMEKASMLTSGRALVIALSLSLPVFAIQVPAGTHLQARFTAKVSTSTAKPKDPVEAVLIAPVAVGDQFVVPAGAKLRGAVDAAVNSTKPEERSTLALTFTELEIDGA